MTAYDDARAAILAAEQQYAALLSTHDAAVAALADTTGELDRVRAEFEAYKTEHPDQPTEPEPQKPTVLMGMSTGSETDARLRETGPVATLRVYQPTWSVNSLVNKIKDARARGVVPVWSMKFPNGWASAASGGDDPRFAELGRALAALDFETYGCFHHEPRDSSIKTPEQLKPWAAANARVIPIVKQVAGAKHHLGVVDNGFPWSQKSKGQALTDAQLAVYYTSALLAAVDFLGGDFYDGATNSNPGEPAAVKMAKFQQWAARVAPGKPLVAGEWNFVAAADAAAAWDVLRSGPWAAACLFNSSSNNRDDLPSSLNGSWVLTGDRLKAFRAVLDQAGIAGR